MSTLPLHPAIVHLPLALAMLAPFASAVGLYLLTKGPGRGAWAAVVALLGILVIGGVVSLRTGEADEDRVEKVTGEAPIEAHEEAAQVFVASGALAFALALGAFFLKAGSARTGVAALTVVATIAAAGLAIRTGDRGGELVYRHGAGAAWSQGAGSAAGQPAQGGGAKDDDDD